MRASDPAQDTFERRFGPEFGHGKALSNAPLRRALSMLGDPQQRLPPVIHVAGTNGKGSTIAFMRAIAEAADQRVHVFTKPHLMALRERFLVGGRPVEDSALIAAAEDVARAAPSLTQFDAQVAAALLLFSQTPADLVLLETGMGGRDDSTNAIAEPALSAITPIGLDHQDVLGSTLEDIAAHKAGIIKPGVPAFVARQRPEALNIIIDRAASVNAPLLRYGADWDAYASAGRLVVQTKSQALDLPLPHLFGPHQLDNAGLACAALLHWRQLQPHAFAQGVANARLPGRMQPLTRGPLSAPIRARGGELWLDGGHNADAAEALARTSRELNRIQARDLVLVIGLRARKDASAFLAPLLPVTNAIVAVPLSEAHVPPEQIVTFAVSGGVQARTAATLIQALATAAALSPAPRVLICGSLLLVREALKGPKCFRSAIPRSWISAPHRLWWPPPCRP